MYFNFLFLILLMAGNAFCFNDTFMNQYIDAAEVFKTNDAKKIKSALTKIQLSKSIDKEVSELIEKLTVEKSIRKLHLGFSELSNKINSKIKSDSKFSKFSLYYCPMVKKYWIQDSEKTGDKTVNIFSFKVMPDCGEKASTVNFDKNNPII